MPPAACQVEPAVSSRRSSSTTSFQPALVRWYRTLAPTRPPPMPTAWNSFFIDPLSVVGRDAALGDTPGDERIELLEDGRVHRRRLVGRQQLLPDPVRLRGEFRRAGLLPRLVVAPVAEHRLMECRLVARLRVLGAEEVAAGTDLLHRREGQRLIIDDDRLEEGRDHPEQLGIKDHLLVARVEAALHPAGAMHQQVDPAL